MEQDVSDIPPKISPTFFSSRFILITLGFLLLIVVGIGAYYLGKRQTKEVSLTSSTPTATSTVSPSPTAQTPPDETANWVTYTSPENTYSFKYPNYDDWKIYPGSGPIASYVNTHCNQCNPQDNIDLFQVTPVIYKSIEEFIEKDTITSDKVKTTFSNLEAVKGVQSGGKQAGGSSINIFVVYKSQGYLIEYRFRNLLDKEKLNQFPSSQPDILSTFKFLDEKQTITPTKTQIIIIPKDWKSFTDTDSQFKITTTLSLPPGYSFRFSGSEWIIQNDSDATEIWDYHPDTSYDGSSRRVWYQKIHPELKILQVEEMPLGTSSYLKFSVETATYDDHGNTSGTQVINHYLYVENNIANTIIPNSSKAYSPQAVISQNIATIFSSLKVSK